MSTFQERAEQAAHRLALADKFLAAHKAYHVALSSAARCDEIKALQADLARADDTLAAAYRETACAHCDGLGEVSSLGCVWPSTECPHCRIPASREPAMAIPGES